MIARQHQFLRAAPALAAALALVVALALTLGAIWMAVLINLRGVKSAGLFAEITTYTKLVPFVAIALVGLFYVDAGNLSQVNPSGEPLLTAAAALAPLTMFAYLGLESATVPAGDVRDGAVAKPSAKRRSRHV